MGSLRWRRHRHLLGLTAVALLLLVVVFGDWRIAAITSSERGTSDTLVTENVTGQGDVFDDGVIHTIEVTFNPAEYRQMLTTYRDEDEKAFIQATVTIDGTTIEQVGLRLKGNSTLMGLREAGGMRDMQQRLREMFVDENATPVPLPSCLPPGFDPFAEPPGAPRGTPSAGAGPPNGNPFGGNISADNPASLPWLLSFDEFVEGRRYQGHTEIAIRPVLMNETMLNEALAMKLIGVAGEPTERAAYAAFTVNGSPASLRLIVEPPGDAFAEANFANDGVLYKALSTGQFAYLGEDPTAYGTAFDQETRRGHQDLKPLISLLRWVDQASDEEFAAELSTYVDVESLARYIAIQSLLENWDDMGGPGQNYYLWYDLETARFTVLTWDLNLALTDMAMGPGGSGQGESAGRPRIDFRQIMECLFPDGLPPEMEMGSGGGPSFGGNPLKDRFLAAPEFQDLYAREYAAVYAALFGDGLAAAELDRLASVIATSDILDAALIENEVAALHARLETLAARGPIPVATPAAATPVPAAAP